MGSVGGRGPSRQMARTKRLEIDACLQRRTLRRCGRQVRTLHTLAPPKLSNDSADMI